MLIAFEGLDQSGKQTQAELLRDRLVADGRTVHLASFPDYTTPIGAELGRALKGERDFGPEIMQLLNVANRYERKAEMQRWLDQSAIVICDRYSASSVAYGEAYGVDPSWLADIQRYLLRPGLTIVLDIAPEVAASRKVSDRDRYERDVAMLARVRTSYHRQAADARDWVVIDGARPREAVAVDVFTAVRPRLARR